MVYLRVGSFSGIYLLYFITSQVYIKTASNIVIMPFLMSRRNLAWDNN